MLDVLSHFAAIDVLRARMQREDANGTASPAVTQALRVMEDHYPYAVLGSVVDQLLAHDTVADTEITILAQAVPIYDQVRVFLADFRDVRRRFEYIARHPKASTALTDYNAARADLAGILNRYDPLIASIQAFAWQWLYRLNYLWPHPQSTDTPVQDWPWRDVVLSRRTGAFAASTMDAARLSGRKEALSFATGVLAGHVGNLYGGPYLTRAVGGPRRSHPYRDRLAAYASGAWLRYFGALPDFGLGPDPTNSVPVFGSPVNPTLPAWLTDLIRQSLHATYGDVAKLPDIDAAYTRLVRHWQLLHSFPDLMTPEPIDDVLDVQIANTLTPQDYDRPDNPPPPAGPAPDGGSGDNIFDPGPGKPPWFMPAHENAWDWVKEGCLDALLLPVFLIRVGFWLGHKASDKKPKSNTGLAASASALSAPMTQAEFDAVAAGPDILCAVDQLAQVDHLLYRLADRCLQVMRLSGLLYPNRSDLASPEFRQFVSPAPPPPGFAWPATPLADPTRSLILPPSTVESPDTTPAAFVSGAKPLAFLIPTSSAVPVVYSDGYALIADELDELPTVAIRTTNPNLDADREPDGPCWRPQPGTSINDNPVAVSVLAYGDV